MEEKGKKIAQEGSAEDRLSNLPRNVIDHIIELLPVRDAARTSILSSNWRYIWADHPWLVLDQQFWSGIKQNVSDSLFQIQFINIVSKILLQHIAPIQKFVLDISNLSPVQFSNVDPWLLNIAFKGLRELTLENTQPYPYRMPSYLFYYLELTNLSLSNCILKPPITFQVFNKLNQLCLQRITLQSTVTISTPALVCLKLKECHGTNILNICAPNLESLTLADNDGLNLSCYKACKNITNAYLALSNGAEHQRSEAEGVKLTELFASWPIISTCVLDGFSIRHLTAGCIREKLSTKLNHLTSLVFFRINYEMDQIVWILYFIRSSPILKELGIWASPYVFNDKTVQNCLEKGCLMMQRIEQLRTVKMKYFGGSRAELLLVKLLLACCTSLETVVVEGDPSLDLSEQLKISREFMGFPRASPKAVIVF